MDSESVFSWAQFTEVVFSFRVWNYLRRSFFLHGNTSEDFFEACMSLDLIQGGA